MEDRTVSTVLMIMGMRDNACRERIVDALGKVRGVRDVDVNLMRARATVTHERTCDASELVWAVVRAGFGAALDGVGRAH